MKPLRIIAKLQNGFIQTDPWSPSIDGILAYYHLKEKLGVEQFENNQGYGGSLDSHIIADDLPIAKIQFKDIWWYCCSTLMFKSVDKHKKYFHRRFDDMHEQFLPEKLPKVKTSSGTYKAFRIPYIQQISKQVEWHTIGDEKKIKRLLTYCFSIGKKGSSGNGKVLEWIILEDGANENWAKYYRSLPIEFAKQNNLWHKNCLVLNWGIRPPGRFIENKYECVMPMV